MLQYTAFVASQNVICDLLLLFQHLIEPCSFPFDYGINDDPNDKTQSGVTLGTPAYMPSEQFENSSTVDNRADIYALGIMLYDMDFEKNLNTPDSMFYHAKMNKGVIIVPPKDSEEILR